MTKSPCKTKRPEGLSFCFGRGGRNRTLIKGFGDLCSTTEPRPYGPNSGERYYNPHEEGLQEGRMIILRKDELFWRLASSHG